MDPIQMAAYERLAKAIEGRSLQGYTEVAAGDVVVVAGAVADADLPEVVKAIVAGAGNNRVDAVVAQKTEALAQLVALAKG
jgi:hypothetical protein